MPSFSANVFDVFEQLRTRHRFVPAQLGSSSRFASLVRYETEEVFVYVFAHDGRSGNVNVDVDLWIAPPDGPGGGLDNLCIGYKLRIASAYEVDDEFFLNSEQRIIHFLPYVQGLIPAVRTEMENPAFRSLRWTVYKMQRTALATLIRAADESSRAAKEALDVAHYAARKKITQKKLEEACIAAAASLMEQGAFAEDFVIHFRSDAKLVGLSLVEMLYVRALGELSASLIE